MNTVYIVGMGTGDNTLMTLKAIDIINNSDVIIGGKRHIDNYHDKEKIEIKNNLDYIIKYIDENYRFKKICILASGDAFMYGIGYYITNKLKHINFKNISGISSIQYMAGVCGLSWNDMYITSIHGRNENICSIISKYKKVGILTAENTSKLIKDIYNSGFNKLYLYIGENLSYENEKISSGFISDFLDKDFSSLCVVIVINNEKNYYNYVSCGIKDELFDRGKVPMTKEEIRALSLSKLKLMDNSIIFDIGCGTGSVTVECGIISKNGFVYSIDKNKEAVELTNRNTKKFNLYNVYVFENDAIKFLNETDIIPTRVFIGGSNGYMSELLDIIYNKCNNVNVVINCITIESVYESIKSLEQIGYNNVECISACISKSKIVGSKNMMIAQNTVYIISGEKGDISER